MKEIPCLIPPSNGDVHDFTVRYRLHGSPIERTRTLPSKSAKNALASFDRGLTKEERRAGVKILGVGRE